MGRRPRRPCSDGRSVDESSLEKRYTARAAQRTGHRPTRGEPRREDASATRARVPRARDGDASSRNPHVHIHIYIIIIKKVVGGRPGAARLRGLFFLQRIGFYQYHDA